MSRGHGISLPWQGQFQPWIHLEPGFLPPQFALALVLSLPLSLPFSPIQRGKAREGKPHGATSQGDLEAQLPVGCSGSAGPDLAGASESAALKNNPKTALISQIWAKMD